MLSFIKDLVLVIFMAIVVTVVVMAVGYGAEWLANRQPMRPTPAAPEITLQTVVDVVALHHGEAISKLEALQASVDQLNKKLDRALGQAGTITEL